MNNISLIAALNKHNIYFIRDNTISYYLSVPKNNNSVNITIEIKNNLDKYDFTKNDTLWVKENVLSYFREIDNTSCSYVIPMFNNSLIQIMGSSDINDYIHAERIITYIINSVYNLLVGSGITPLREVILVKNDSFLSFISYFKNKYKNRIGTTTVLELLQENIANYTNYKKLETDDMNFVIGNDNPSNISVNNDVTIASRDEALEKPQTVSRKPVPASSGGYVAYYLLAIVAVIFAVFILYLLI